MPSESTKVIAQALVDLAFAQAEIELNGNGPEHMSRVLRHIRHAKARLKAIAPEFEAHPAHGSTRAA